MSRENNKQEEKLAIQFVKNLQEKFTVPIEDKLNEFIGEQDMSEEDKQHFKKMLMLTIGNSILLKSGASRRDLKNSYRGLIADYDKMIGSNI